MSPSPPTPPSPPAPAPSPRAGALARALDLSGPLLTRYLDGFTDGNRTRQAPGLPNHAAWTLGHCAIAMHRLANRLTGASLFPEADFVVADDFDPEHPGEATGRFSTASVVFDSTPIDRPALYPLLDRSVEVFGNARVRLSDLVQAMTDADLDRAHSWHDSTMSGADLIARLTFHNGTHAGQLTDLRRALGFPPIIA